MSGKSMSDKAQRCKGDKMVSDKKMGMKYKARERDMSGSGLREEERATPGWEVIE